MGETDVQQLNKNANTMPARATKQRVGADARGGAFATFGHVP
jgi:hypothetical protein